jgi:hypothetical protein
MECSMGNNNLIVQPFISSGKTSIKSGDDLVCSELILCLLVVNHSNSLFGGFTRCIIFVNYVIPNVLNVAIPTEQTVPLTRVACSKSMATK